MWNTCVKLYFNQKELVCFSGFHRTALPIDKYISNELKVVTLSGSFQENPLVSTCVYRSKQSTENTKDLSFPLGNSDRVALSHKGWISWRAFYPKIHQSKHSALRKDFVILQLYWWLFSSTKQCGWNMV